MKKREKVSTTIAISVVVRAITYLERKHKTKILETKFRVQIIFVLAAHFQQRYPWALGVLADKP